MKIRFTPNAFADLASIADYLRPINPTGLANVRKAILKHLHIIMLYPEIGRLQQIDRIRKVTVRKYGYVIYYLVIDNLNEIVVLSIKHGRRQHYEN